MPAPHREIILASAARTALVSGVPLRNLAGWQNCMLVFDWTVEAVSSTLTPAVSIEAIAGTSRIDVIWTAAAGLTAVGTYAYLFSGGGLIASDFNGQEAVGFSIPPVCQFSVAVGDADSATYSVEAHWW